MPQRAPWNPDDSAGIELIDSQHQALLSRCNLLAEHCAPNGPINQDIAFDQAFEKLVSLVREHMTTEASMLAELQSPHLEDHRIECEEFEALADEVATAAYFDRLELQRFVTLWCMSHIMSSARQVRLSAR